MHIKIHKNNKEIMGPSRAHGPMGQALGAKNWCGLGPVFPCRRCRRASTAVLSLQRLFSTVTLPNQLHPCLARVPAVT